MRKIPSDNLVLPPGWNAKKLAAEKAVAKSLDKPKTIGEFSNVWGELKENLSKISKNKCFYCETVRVRDDYQVDHYRPKSGVEANGHRGYWWLAFEVSNLRFACRFCNERRVSNGAIVGGGGKSSEFPLLKGGIRATKPDDILRDEYPALIDPYRGDEVGLIGFNDLGVATPQASREDEPVYFERARASIRIYHLNHAYIRRRREQKALVIRRKIAEVTLQLALAIRRHGTGNEQAALDAISRAGQIMDELGEMRGQDEEYSMLTTHILKLNQGANRRWIDRLLATPA
ncbi:hypothetical protein [Methylobacterium sp. 17Sr1-1]|uniref:hypothetical protein n=1 Tax=Methylobacterium sp. 17Sr1-1 TaxID=2202826 RepID=UPI0013A5B6E2|nr:hypothetical protein [Methylobacterium sp. 17Sr1-1]